MAEIIAYIEREELARRDLLAHGFTPDRDRRRYDALGALLAWGERAALEEDPRRKQLIPYVIVHRPGALWTMRRKRAQREARLHDRLSLGVGGHLERLDGGGHDPIEAGMLRELAEELVLDEVELALRYEGLLNDDRDPVGRVHLGVVFSARALSGELAIRETEKMEGFWSTPAQLKRELERLETWSALLMEAATAWASVT